MNAEIHRTLSAISEEPRVAMEVLERFESALSVCCDGFDRGDTMVVLPENLPVLLGDGIAQLFKKALAEKAGSTPSTIGLTPMETASSSHTIVNMPKNKAFSSQVQSGARFVETSSGTEVDLDTLAAEIIKKAPRPMNCWIIFRDAKSKDLKIEFPDLTVQEISQRCSDMWRELGPVGKAPWQAAAQMAKEEHLRQHPDYKYSPRRPGQKKKRQSRKAKRAATVAIVPEVLNFQVAPSIATSSLSSTYDDALPVNAITADAGNPFTNDFAQFFDSADMLDMFPQDSVSAGITYDSESFRHARLDDEFNFNFAMDNTFPLLDDDLFAFRDGADGDAIVPAVFNDTY